MAEPSVDAVAPRQQRAALGHGERVVVAHRDRAHALALERLDSRRRRPVVLVAQAELALAAVAPRVDAAAVGEREAEGVAGHDTREALGRRDASRPVEARHAGPVTQQTGDARAVLLGAARTKDTVRADEGAVRGAGGDHERLRVGAMLPFAPHEPRDPRAVPARRWLAEWLRRAQLKARLDGRHEGAAQQQARDAVLHRQQRYDVREHVRRQRAEGRSAARSVLESGVQLGDQRERGVLGVGGQRLTGACAQLGGERAHEAAQCRHVCCHEGHRGRGATKAVPLAVLTVPA